MACDLTIIVVTYNSERFVRNCLGSLFANLPQEYSAQVVVVDNASSDRSAEIVEQEFPAAVLIRSPTNTGFGQGNNLGMRECPAHYYYLHNADAYLQDNVLDEALALLDADRSIGVAGLPLVFPDHSPQTAAYSHSTPAKWLLQATFVPALARYVARSRRLSALRSMLRKISMARSFIDTHAESHRSGLDGKPVEYDWVCGAAMLLSEEVRQAVGGGFDPAIFLYGEDEDICICARQAGYRVVQLPVRPVIHEYGWGSSRKASPQVIALKTQSLAVFIDKHFARFSPSWLAMRTMLMLKSLYWKLL